MGSIKEIENTVETIVEISETKSDRPTQTQNGEEISRIIVPQKDSRAVTYSKEDEISETKSDSPTQPHHGKKIDRIIVSQYIDDELYAVTYSKEDNSILGWNIEENGQQRPHMYFKLDQIYYITSSVLYKKILVFSYNSRSCVKVIDLSGDKGRFLQLNHKENSNATCLVELLSNGDLIIASLERIGNYSKKIYKYSFINKPTDATLWEHSQIYDIETHKSLNILYDRHCFVYQTKLFLVGKGILTQWDLSTMTFEMQYNLVGLVSEYGIYRTVINKNQKLLALHQYRPYEKIDIYSMETGVHISRCENYSPEEFVTLKDGSEGLLIFNYKNKKYKFIDPFHSFTVDTDAIDVPDDMIVPDENIFKITKSNKIFYIKENNVCVKDCLNENTFQQMLNTTYHSNLYTLPILKTIKNMVKDIDENHNLHTVNRYDGELFRFELEYDRGHYVNIKGLKKSQNNNEWKETQNTMSLYYGLLSCTRQLNNQDLALVTSDEIYIYTIIEDHLRLRYYYEYDRIQQILDHDLSLPSPTLYFNKNSDEFKELALSIINEPVEFSKYGSEILKMAIRYTKITAAKYKEVGDNVIQLVFEKIIELIEIED